MSSGDRCPCFFCRGRMVVRTSKTTGTLQTQYLSCNVCGCRGGKVHVPAAKVHRKIRVVPYN